MKQKPTPRRITAYLLAFLLIISLLPPLQVSASENNYADQFQNIPTESENNCNGYIVKLKQSKAVSLFSDLKSELEVISPENDIFLASSMEQIEKMVPLSAIEYIEPNYKLHPLDSNVNDTLYTSGAQWNLDAMKVPKAWSKGQYGEGVTVAVIDSGMFGICNGESHEDIDSKKIVKPYNFLAKNTDVTDSRGHGTYVAGIIFAKTNNGTGVAGIMPEVKIMPLKVFGVEDADTAHVISAIEYAVDNGADVINLSLGGKDASQALKSACDAAVAKGVLVVAAAGNDGTSTPFYPAAFDSVIGVAALDTGNTRYQNSQYGDSVYVSAPGAKIAVIDNKTNQYSVKSGTSMSAPQVAALGAMAKSINPNINQDGFKQLLQQTCTDLGEKGFDIFFGWGAINFETAADKLLGTETHEHTYGPWVSNGETTHSRTCSGCGHRETSLHIWDNGTTGDNGITYTCTVCGEKRVSANPISDVWEYNLINNGEEVELTKYIGTQTNVIVPSTLDINGKKLPVTAIGNKTFMGSSILWVELPDSITKVEDGYASTSSGVIGAFAYCKNLTVVKLSPNMKKIADYMFYGSGSDYRLELTIPNGISEIGDSAFSMCNSLAELNLPHSVKKIGNSAFYQCRRLATLNIPGVTTIESDAFTETIFEETYENLWKAGKFEGIVYAGKVAYLYFGPYSASGSSEYKRSVMPENTNLVLSDGTLGISEFLFQSHYIDQNSCKNNLKSITVPETLQYIPENFFSGFAGMDLYGFPGSYAQTYAASCSNISFKPIITEKEQKEAYEWYDKPADKNLYVINTAEDLRGFADIVNINENNFKDATVKIGKDIDLGGLTSSGYGVSANQWFALNGFQGTLDGQGHTISGIYVNCEQNYQGFFAELSSTCTIKNLNLKGKVTGGDYVGGLVGKSSGASIENCSFNGTVDGGQKLGYVGGIAGYASGKISGCSVAGSVTNRIVSVSDVQFTGSTGGITGYAAGCNIEKCENNASVICKAYSAGGIAGHMFMMSKISDCTNNAAISGLQFVGGIAGRVTAQGEKLINNCINNGTVTGTTYAGGIAGVTVGYGSSIEECTNKGSVDAKNYAAGILGYSEASKVKKCCNDANITAFYSAAGIIAKDSGFGVEDSYKLGNITASANHAGGIVAFATNGENESSIINCYNMGKITAADGADPLGNVYNNGNIFKNCYYLSDKENTSVPNRKGKTAEAFKNGSVAYSLGSSYGQTIGKDLHPVFRTQSNAVLTDGTNYYNEGQSPSHSHSFGEWVSDGPENHKRTCACGASETAPHTWDSGIVEKPATETEPGVMKYTCTVCGAVKTEVIPIVDNIIKIGTIAELQAFAKAVDEGDSYKDKTVLLTADIDASGTAWNPIGYYISTKDFKNFAGTFDGQGHTVTINACDQNSSGFGFIAVNSGTIKNLTVAGTISAKSYVGGIAGKNGGKIESCTNKADISGTSTAIGGIAGYCETNSYIENCANFGNVVTVGAQYVGGIVGQTLAKADICCCFNSGSVSGTKGYIGGIAGYALDNVHNCYNTGTVSTSDTKSKTIGGIAGYLMGTGNIKNCYSTGMVNAAYSAAIAGNATAPKLSNNYYLSGSASYGIYNLSSTEGCKSSDEMKTADFLSSLGDAFTADYSGKSSINSGYPILKWQVVHTHSFGEWVSDGPENHKRTCACGASETAPHTWDSGIVEKPATETEPGVMKYTCTVCGAVKTEIIPKLPSSGSGSGNIGETDTSTIVNPDGSITTITKDNLTGTLVETTNGKDGSKTVRET
ncbi:MAG: S8 family serine peptidase [Clostridiales bacterium]|nr:S8 family serine peptidase [Clostridiales bacterium]